MKTVLDCNVIISAGLTDGVCRKIVKTVLDKHTNFISDPILCEYKNVIGRKKFCSVRSQLFSILEVVCELSEWVQLNNHDIILPDEGDVIYINTSITANVDVLITGNIKDFPDQQYHGVRVVTPAEFLILDSK